MSSRNQGWKKGRKGRKQRRNGEELYREVKGEAKQVTYKPATTLWESGFVLEVGRECLTSSRYGVCSKCEPSLLSRTYEASLFLVKRLD